MNTLKARRRLSRSEGFAIISDYLHSGMGCKEYYTSHEISEWPFYKWKRLYLLEHPQEPPSDEIKKETNLQVDESPIPVLTADKPGATHKGYMWVFNSPVKGQACFLYDKSRSGEVVDTFLGDYKGTLQTDAYTGYDPTSIGKK